MHLDRDCVSAWGVLAADALAGRGRGHQRAPWHGGASGLYGVWFLCGAGVLGGHAMEVERLQAVGMHDGGLGAAG